MDAEPESRKRSFLRELPVLLVVALAVALLIKTFIIQAFFIPSGSMIPTLVKGDRVLVEKVSYLFGEPERGDVVVFEHQKPGLTGTDEVDDDNAVEDLVDSFRSLFGFPTGTSEDLIKRVIAVEGELVEGTDGKVYVDGEEIDEPYLPDGVRTESFSPIRVDEGEIFVMGDNRPASSDSRSFGPVSVEKVVGHAFVIIWPPSDAGSL